jgi:hypothetical protein
MAYPIPQDAQPDAVPQQLSDGSQYATAGEQLAPGRRIHLDVQINKNLAQAGSIDVKMNNDTKDVWKQLVAAIEAHVKDVVPRTKRFGRAVKFETLVLGTRVSGLEAQNQPIATSIVDICLSYLSEGI